MNQSFGDVLATWVLIVGPLAGFVALYWLTHRDNQRNHPLTKPFERIADTLEKKSPK